MPPRKALANRRRLGTVAGNSLIGSPVADLFSFGPMKQFGNRQKRHLAAPVNVGVVQP